MQATRSLTLMLVAALGIAAAQTATAASPSTRAGICHHCENPSISPLVMRCCTRSEEAKRHGGIGRGGNAAEVNGFMGILANGSSGG
jgi:hypothetical protein